MALSAIFFLIFIIHFPVNLFAWPTSGQWIPVYRNNIILQDSISDANGSRNIVSDSNNVAAFIYNDGTYIYFRLRLDSDPSGGGGQGFLQPYGWGVLLDTNLNASNYEWLIMVDGISQTEIIGLWHNTNQGALGSPGDSPETLAHSLLLNTNYQITPANTSINGNLDYFLDWRFPYDIMKQYTGLTDTSPLRLFFGSANNASTITADLVGASDLYAGFSDYITPFGTKPTTGIIRFVDITGNTDVTQEYIGNILYLRVDDADRNYNPTALNTLQVTLSVPGGDTETITLTETGVNTGVFTGPITLTYGTPAAGDNIFQAAVGSTITATYIDAIDANLLLNQPRTDTLLVRGPVINVTKSVAPSTAEAGGTVTYTITISNTGTGMANVTQLVDVLPPGFAYVQGTTSGLTTLNPTVNGQILTWNGTWQVPAGENRQLVFNANAGSISGTFLNNVSVSGLNFPAFYTGDTAPVTIGAALMTLSKTVDKISAIPGEEITYSIHYRNIGAGEALNIVIIDSIPLNTSYVSGSLRAGTAGSTYNTAIILTDISDTDAGYISGSTIIFVIPSVSPDDGTPGSGTDEGKVYFKVTVN